MCLFAALLNFLVFIVQRMLLIFIALPLRFSEFGFEQGILIFMLLDLFLKLDLMDLTLLYVKLLLAQLALHFAYALILLPAGIF